MFIKLAFKNVAHVHNPYSKVIAIWTGGIYSHVELWFSGEPNNALCFSSREGSGTSFKNIDLTQAYDSVTVTTDNIIAMKCLNAAQALDHKKYDWIGIVGFVLPFGEHDSRNRFCSEVCYELLCNVGLMPNDEAMYKVSPVELANKATFLFGAAQPLYPIEK